MPKNLFIRLGFFLFAFTNLTAYSQTPPKPRDTTIVGPQSQDLCHDRHLEATGAFMERETARGRRRYMAAPWRHLGLPRQRLDTVEGETAINAVFSDLLGLSRERIEALRADGTIAAR